MQELLTFKRGASDIKKILNIGELEGLRIKLEKLGAHPAVEYLHTTHIQKRNLEGYTTHRVKVLRMRLDFRNVKERYDHIDKFLIQYLEPHFFCKAEIDDN